MNEERFSVQVADQQCEHCFGSNIITDCARCGAPNCCNDCCVLATEQLLLHQRFPLSRKAFDGLMLPVTEHRTWPLLFDRSLNEPWTLGTSDWFDLGRITERAIGASSGANDSKTTMELIRFKQHIQGLLTGKNPTLLYAKDEEEFDEYPVAIVPVGMDPERATKIAENNLVLNNECIRAYRSAINAEAERLGAKYPIEGEWLDVPRWAPGLSAKEITSEMRAERTRIEKHNQDLTDRANKVKAARMDEEHEIGLKAIAGKFPEWAIRKVADGRASMRYRKYEVRRIGSMANPENKF